MGCIERVDRVLAGLRTRQGVIILLSVGWGDDTPPWWLLRPCEISSAQWSESAFGCDAGPYTPRSLAESYTRIVNGSYSERCWWFENEEQARGFAANRGWRVETGTDDGT